MIDFGRHWAGAGGGGGGLLEASDSEILASSSARSAPLKGCGEFKGFAPCRRPLHRDYSDWFGDW